MLFKKNPVKKMSKIIDRLDIAIGKLLIARNVLEKLKREKQDHVLLMTAFAGMPISSRGMAIMYIESALKDLEKIRKDIEGIGNWMSKNKVSIYYSRGKQLLDRINKEIANVLENPDDDVNVLIRKFSSIKTDIQAFLDLVNLRN